MCEKLSGPSKYPQRSKDNLLIWYKLWTAGFTKVHASHDRKQIDAYFNSLSEDLYNELATRAIDDAKYWENLLNPFKQNPYQEQCPDDRDLWELFY